MTQTAQQKIVRHGFDFTMRQKPPLLRTHSIPITIRRYFTTVDGTVIDKAISPVGVRLMYPFFTFGNFDQKGGYNNGLKVLPAQPGSKYLLSFVEGYGLTSEQITGFTGLNDLKTRLKLGDIVHVFTDDYLPAAGPNVFIWVVQSTKNNALASIIANAGTTEDDKRLGRMAVDFFQYFTDNPDGQWQRPVHFTRSNNLTMLNDDMVMPYIFKTPQTEQNGFIRIDCEMGVNQYQSIGTYFLFETEEIQMNFTLNV